MRNVRYCAFKVQYPNVLYLEKLHLLSVPEGNMPLLGNCDSLFEVGALLVAHFLLMKEIMLYILLLVNKEKSPISIILHD